MTRVLQVLYWVGGVLLPLVLIVMTVFLPLPPSPVPQIVVVGLALVNMFWVFDAKLSFDRFQRVLREVDYWRSLAHRDQIPVTRPPASTTGGGFTR